MGEYNLSGALALVNIVGIRDLGNSEQVVGYSPHLEQDFNVDGATMDMIGESYLVRLALRENPVIPKQAFLVGSKVPDNFPGVLEHGAYVLLGKWIKQEMVGDYDQDSVASFEDVARYFRPGELTRTIFIKEGSVRRRGRKLLTEDGTRREVRDTLGRIVARGIHWLHCPALIVYVGDVNEKELRKTAWNRAIIDVAIDPHLPR
tara:strand:- start:1121 stop:1732 length:612 start_codon:yes stop_codon:yes gene_type:complete